MVELQHRILLVEDHAETRHMLRRILALTLTDWEVTEAATVEEGLAQLDPPPDCVLLDLELPDGPGEAILRKVRQDHLQTRVVVNTGTNDEARLGAVSDLKPAAVLQKPLDSTGLRRIYRAAIELTS
jgi:DNA-binding NarL/FixJ family response regulator